MIKEGSEYKVITHWKPAIQDFMVEAGRKNPAIYRFEVRQGVGYLFPIRPIPVTDFAPPPFAPPQ